MLRTLFISDLHLCEDKPNITAGFLRFLKQEAKTADALYILGDLFDVWIGDDDLNSYHKQIALELQALPSSVYFIHGNRDFLLGKKYAKISGMSLLKEKHVLHIYGHSLLIMHGDILCTNDMGYQRFRYIVHQCWLQKLFLSLPIRLRQYIALLIRSSSRNVNNQKSMENIDINDRILNKMMSHYRVQYLIHGHTHRPAIHILTVNEQPANRLVLGSWKTFGSMIEVTPRGVNLVYFYL